MNNAKQMFCFALIGLVCAGAASAQVWGRDNTAHMAVYTPYGLTWDSAKDTWTYQNKIVGLMVDEAGRGKIFLSPAGEIHIKVTRDAYGKISALTAMSTAEYNTYLEEIDAMQTAIAKRMSDMRSSLFSGTRLRGRGAWF